MFNPNAKFIVVGETWTMKKLIGKSLKFLRFTNLVEAAAGASECDTDSAEPTIRRVSSGAGRSKR